MSQTAGADKGAVSNATLTPATSTGGNPEALAGSAGPSEDNSGASSPSGVSSTFDGVSTATANTTDGVTVKAGSPSIQSHEDAAPPLNLNIPSNTSSSSTPGPSPGPARKKSQRSGKVDPSLVYTPSPWYRLWIYDIFLWAFGIIFDCFFREIRPRGAFRLPRTGAVIFVAAPHANQFVDPIILMNQVKRESQRRISFLIAAKSYKQKVIGMLSKCQLSIPVVRAQDNLVKGTGRIFIDINADPLRVRGKGTKFLSECSPKGLIALPQSLGASEIVEVVSDTEIILRKEFKTSQKITSLLTSGTAFKTADKVDQKSVYQMVFKHLSHGNCIGIFPEGGSHDRTDLLPLKAGVAIMALGAMDNDPHCNVSIVPCGMNYFNAHKFRSRAVVEFGHPITIPRELVKKYANPETNRESVKELLDIVTTGLKAVTVTCEDFETLLVIQAARRLYAGNLAQYLPLALVVEMNRRLVLGYQTFKDKPEVQQVKRKILKYNEMLKQLYLPDHHVEDCDESNKLRLLPIFIYRLIKLVFFLVLALPGATLFSPVFITSKIISTRKAATALANSTVKIKANDVVATWKILIGMGIAPVVYSFYASVGTYYYNRGYPDGRLSLIWVWCVLYGCGVLVTYSALITGEQGMDLFKSLRPLYLSITSGSSIKELKAFRNELSEEITSLVNTFGPELFPHDFNLLAMKDHLQMKDISYVDSDEEEDRKTEELRNRRIRKRKEEKARKARQDPTSLAEISEEHSGLAHSSSVSDGISLMNSDNSLTNIPMFSDYHLHANAKNVHLTLEQQSNFNSTISMADDYAPQPHSRLLRTDSSEGVEFSFASSSLSDRIKNRMRQNREGGNS